jgi:hypothetical protein
MNRFKLVKGIKDYYETNFIWVDVILSLILTFLLLCGTPMLHFIKINDLRDFNSAIISFFGTITGFLITGVTIIYALSSEPKTKALKRLSQTGIYPRIYGVYFHTTIVSLLLIISGFIYVLLDVPKIFLLESNYLIFLMEFFLLILFIFRMYRCLWILGELVSIAHSNEEHETV